MKKLLLITAAVLFALPLLAGGFPEEPVLITVDLEFKDGSDLFCVFQGEVLIEQGVLVSGCPTGEFFCEELIFAQINGFAPFVEALECSPIQVFKDGFELNK